MNLQKVQIKKSVKSPTNVLPGKVKFLDGTRHNFKPESKRTLQHSQTTKKLEDSVVEKINPYFDYFTLGK